LGFLFNQEADEAQGICADTFGGLKNLGQVNGRIQASLRVFLPKDFAFIRDERLLKREDSVMGGKDVAGKGAGS
jgi:hypothetical protein